MTITALPALDRSSATFKTDVDTFFGSALPQMVSQINADLAEVVYGGITATQAEMEAGTLPAVRAMSPLRVKQAIQATAPSEAVGTLKYSPVTPGAGWLRCDGASYLQSAFPALFGIVGLRPSGIPQPVAVNNNPFTVYVRGIAAVKDTFYVRGSNGAEIHRYTKDGVTWNNITAFAVTVAWSVTYNDILFVWPGSGNVIWYTKDECATWASVNIGYKPSSNPALHYQGGRYFINLDAAPWMVTSTDLVTWTPCTGLTQEVQDAYDTERDYPPSLVCKNGVWLTRPSGGSTYNTVFRSADGVAWTPQVAACNTAEVVRQVWAAGDYFFATANPSGSTNTYQGYLSRSSDGITWTNYYPWPPGILGSRNIMALGRVGGMYYAIQDEDVLFSDDGASWSSMGFTSGRLPSSSFIQPIFIDGVGVFLADRFEANTSTPIRFMSIVDGTPSSTECLLSPSITSTTALYEGGTAWGYLKRFVRGNLIFYVPSDGATSTSLLWRTTDKALEGGRTVAWGGTWAANASNPAMSRTKLMLASGTTAAGSMVISPSFYGYDVSTEFATPVISSPIPNSTVWIKAV